MEMVAEIVSYAAFMNRIKQLMFKKKNRRNRQIYYKKYK